MDTNLLYDGDNLDSLRRYPPDAAVDLVDLDPPFNSNRGCAGDLVADFFAVLSISSPVLPVSWTTTVIA